MPSYIALFMGLMETCELHWLGTARRPGMLWLGGCDSDSQRVTSCTTRCGRRWEMGLLSAQGAALRWLRGVENCAACGGPCMPFRQFLDCPQRSGVRAALVLSIPSLMSA